MQQTGHRPIALMGGGTTRVGDPSGKDESRRILTDAMIEENLTGIRAVFSKFLKFEGAGGNALMANNADWLNSLNYIDFLRDVGRHFSVNRMLSFDSVKMSVCRTMSTPSGSGVLMLLRHVVVCPLSVLVTRTRTRCPGSAGTRRSSALPLMVRTPP